MESQVIVVIYCLVAMVTGCPDYLGCTCDLHAKSMICGGLRNVTWSDLLVQVPDFVEQIWIKESKFSIEVWNMEDQDVVTENIAIPMLANLKGLCITNSNIVHLDHVAFGTMPNVKELHFNNVNITNNTLSHLSALSRVEVVDLSHNQLTEMPDHVITSWPALRELYVHHNDFKEFNFHVFHQESPVRSLDLSYNNISFIHPESFRNGTSLNKLNLQSNQLRYLHDNIVHNISHSTALHLADNPWACHCGMDWLVKALRSSADSLVNYADSRQIQCATPQDLKSTCLMDLSPDLLVCEPPEIQMFPSNQTILYMQHQVLDCNITGYPLPSVYWLTPHGPIVHPDHRYWVPHQIASAPDHITFTGQPYFFHPVAAVHTQSNGSLLFVNYRHYFDGEYVCVAVNPAGSLEHSLNITVVTMMPSEVIWTMIWGLSGAGGFFLLAMALGCLLQCIRKVCLPTKFVPGPDLMQPELTVIFPDEYYAQYDDYDEDYGDDDYTNKRIYYHDYDVSPVQSYRGSPRRSPLKCVTPAVTPAEFHDDEHKYVEMGMNIRDTLESVRLRLRQNMERHMERMRSRTQHMQQTSRKYIKNVRSSTGKTMKTLKHTSSQYVHKMREGVVQGVEQVKCHVQSMKELCGPGHMTHTISTISVSTDIDSNQKKHVYKSITYV